MINARHVLAVLVLVAACFAAFLYSSTVQDLIITGFLSKGQTYSGIERLRSIVLAWDYFTEYPILGIGWGSATSHDLIVKLLSNVGILGLMAFLYFIYTLFKRLRPFIAQRTRSFWEQDGHWKTAVVISLTVLLVLNVLTGFAFVYGHFWLVIGWAIAAPQIAASQVLRKAA